MINWRNNTEFGESPFMVKTKTGEVFKAIEEQNGLVTSNGEVLMDEEYNYKYIVAWKPCTTIYDIINDLRGTCKDLDEVLDSYDIEYMELTDESFQEIDNQIFKCNTCGWWCCMSDENDVDDEQVCDDCIE